MAGKKEHNLVSAGTQKPGTPKPNSHKKVAAKPVGNATGLRIGAIALWAVAIALEVLALLVVLGKLDLGFMPALWQIIAFLVLDLVCVIIGSQLWKKANHIKPASEKNKVGFWIWNNMGVIVCTIAFIPIIIIMLTNKDLDKKTKVVATIVAIVACLIGGAASIDYNPVSQEQQQAAIENIEGDVFWAPFGKVYHTHEDCGSLNQTETLTYGSVEEAIAAGRTRLCSFCAKKDDITGVVTDNVDTGDDTD